MTHPLVNMVLLDVERNSSAVLLRPYREVQPADRASLLEEQLIEVPLSPIGDIQ